MKMIKMKKFRKGAASFYVVAFSTLILVIIAASFAAVVVSEITRTSNDDLAQSAYDSALAGVEDAKLAFYSYRNCLKDSNITGCDEIIRIMSDPVKSCYMTGRILGRLGLDEENEVMIQETNTSENNMYQAYTCVKINTLLSNYQSTLNANNPVRIMTARFGSDDENIADHDGVVNAERIKKVKISWFSDVNKENSIAGLNYYNTSNGKVSFPSLSGIGTPTPPTISLAVLQTSATFKLSDFEVTRGGQTDRGMVYLVPARSDSVARIDKEDNYIGAWNGVQNSISKSALLKSNDKTAKNLPYVVYCDPRSVKDYYCETTIELPEPIGGDRNNETFVFIASLPYGKPETDFMLEFFCDETCSVQTVVNEDGTTEEISSNVAYLDGVQVGVDSTGRANDLFRRIEARLEGSDAFALSLLGPLELSGDEGSDALVKNFAVTSEWNFR